MRRDYIAPYRRHLDTCEHRAKGKDFTLCECPIWGYGYVAGQPFRRSLQTADWPRALRRIEILLNGGDLAPEPPTLTVRAALDAFFADAKARHLKPDTIRSYHYTLDSLGEALGRRPLSALDVDTLSRFREGRKVKPKTARKEIEHLRAFCAFCVDRGWMSTNPARKVKPPRTDYVSTLPFTEDEVARLLDACDRMRAMHQEDLRYVRQRARALVLVLLYSGLRISDVAVLERSAISSSGHLLLQQIKPGVPVRLLLNRDAIEALEALPAPGGNPRYYFWTGRGSPKSCRGSLARTIYRLGKLAGVKAHPHRFRDHFAVELLTNGADIRTVQLLLGHKSVKTTEKSYAHFVAAHQKILDSAAAALDFSKPKARRPLLVKPLKNTRRNAK